MTQALNLANFANNLNTSGATTNAGLQNSAVTVTAGTGMSGGGAVSLGSSVTLTNAGVTSVTAGTGISVSASTGSVTISSTSSGGVTSLNAQTGAVVTTSLDVIGSMSVLMYAGNSSLSGINNTAAGSSLRYDPTLYRGTANGPFNGWCYANNSSSYTGGGSALSGTWRKMSSGSVYNVSGPPCNTDYTWAQALWVRIS